MADFGSIPPVTLQVGVQGPSYSYCAKAPRWRIASPTLTYSFETGLAIPGFLGSYRINGVILRNGVPGRYKIYLVHDKTAVRSTQSNQKGEFTFWGLSSTDRKFTIVSYDPFGEFKPAEYFDYVVSEANPSPVTIEFSERKSTVKTHRLSGVISPPAEVVSIRGWNDKKTVGAAIPDPETGAWSIDVPPGDYDVTYYITGCLPNCYGPYTAEEIL